MEKVLINLCTKTMESNQIQNGQCTKLKGKYQKRYCLIKGLMLLLSITDSNKNMSKFKEFVQVVQKGKKMSKNMTVKPKPDHRCFFCAYRENRTDRGLSGDFPRKIKFKELTTTRSRNN